MTSLSTRQTLAGFCRTCKRFNIYFLRLFFNFTTLCIDHYPKENILYAFCILFRLGSYSCTNYKIQVQWTRGRYWKVFRSRCHEIGFKQNLWVQGVRTEISDVFIHLSLDDFVRNANGWNARSKSYQGCPFYNNSFSWSSRCWI